MISKSLLNKDYQTNKTLQAYSLCQQNNLSSVVSWPLGPLSVMKHFLELNMIHKEIYPAQTTIARKLGLSRVHINRIIKFLCKEGFLEKIRIPGLAFDTCLYSVLSPARMQKHRITHIWNMKRWASHALALSILITPSSAAKTIDVTPYKLKDSYLFKKQCSTLKATAKPTQSIFEEANVCMHARVVVPMKQDFITPELQQATKLLHLTKWGQIKLSAYPEQALSLANARFKQSKTIKHDPFRWYISVCNGWCKDNNIAPDWSTMHKRALQHQMPDNPSMIQDKKEQVSSSTPTRIEPKYSSTLISKEREAYKAKQVLWEAQFTPQQLQAKRDAINPFLRDFLVGQGANPIKLDAIIEASKPVTEPKSPLNFPSIDEQDKIWDRLETVPVIFEDSEWEEI